MSRRKAGCREMVVVRRRKVAFASVGATLQYCYRGLARALQLRPKYVLRQQRAVLDALSPF